MDGEKDREGDLLTVEDGHLTNYEVDLSGDEGDLDQRRI